MKPDQPKDAPAYAVNPLDKQSPKLLEQIAEYCEKLAEHKRELKAEQEIDEDKREELLEEKEPVIQEEMVRCGKDDCKSCPHGPYRYKYVYDDGEIKSEYIGHA